MRFVNLVKWLKLRTNFFERAFLNGRWNYFASTLRFLFFQIFVNRLQIKIEFSGVFLPNFMELFNNRIFPHKFILPLVRKVYKLLEAHIHVQQKSWKVASEFLHLPCVYNSMLINSLSRKLSLRKYARHRPRLSLEALWYWWICLPVPSPLLSIPTAEYL